MTTRRIAIMGLSDIFIAPEFPTGNCTKCRYSIRGVCALICWVPSGKCDFYEERNEYRHNQ